MTLLHGLASRHDLPLPFELVVGGGAVVLLLTFWIALFAWRHPRYTENSGVPLPRLTRLVDSRAFSLSLVVLTALAWVIPTLGLFFGVDRIDNPVFGFVFVLLWVGLVPMALLFGKVYHRTNPFHLLYRSGGHDRDGSLAWAAAAVVVFAYLELVQPGATTLPVLRWFATAYVIWLIAGTWCNWRWVCVADPFEAYANVVARLSVWHRGPDHIIRFGNPLRNLASWPGQRGLALLASSLLGATLFDAASNTASWVKFTQTLDGWAVALGAVGLLVSVALVYGLFWLGTRPYRAASMDQLAPGLIPLVVGYCLAHYATMVYLEGQRTLIRYNDPLGLGWNLFGFAEAGPHTALFGYPGLIAVLQVLAIVGGHALGVLVTHDIALRYHVTSVRAHLPLLGIMVAFTVAGLLLMFSS